MADSFNVDQSVLNNSYQKVLAAKEEADRREAMARAQAAALSGSMNYVTQSTSTPYEFKYNKEEAVKNLLDAKAKTTEMFKMMGLTYDTQGAIDASNNYAKALKNEQDCQDIYNKAVEEEKNFMETEEYKIYLAAKTAQEEANKPTTSRSTWDITKELETFATRGEHDGRWMANIEDQERMNNLLFEMDVAQKQQDKEDNYDSYGSSILGLNYLLGVEDFDTNTRVWINKKLGLNNPKYMMQDSALNTAVDEKMKTATDTQRFFGSAARSIGEQTIPMLLSAVLPGAGLGKKATQIIKLAKVIPIYISQGGSSYRDSIKQGFSEDEANSYATLNSMVSAGLEYTFGAIGGSELTKGLVGKGTKLITKYLGSKTDDVIRAVSKLELVKQWAKNTVGSAIGESIEEFSEAVLQPLAENIAYRGRAGYNFTENPIDIKPEYFERALMGFVTGGILGGASGDTTNHSKQVNSNTQIETKTDSNITETDGIKTERLAENTPRLTDNEIKTLTPDELNTYADNINNEYVQHLKNTTNFTEEQIQAYLEETGKDISPEGKASQAFKQQTEMLEWAENNKNSNENTPVDEASKVKESTGDEKANVEIPIPYTLKNLQLFTENSETSRTQNANIERQNQIQKILSVDHAQLKQMSISELKQFATEAARINAESMNISKENFAKYLNEVLSDDPATMIRNIERTQGDLGVEVDNLKVLENKSVEINKLNENSNDVKIQEDHTHQMESEAIPKFISKVIDPNVDTKVYARVKELRSNLTSKYKKSGNFGYADVNIEGLDKYEFFAHSSINNDSFTGELSTRLPEISLDPINPAFEALKVNNDNIIDGPKAYMRNNDTEYKILNDIANRLGDMVETFGTIKLFTERVPCPSCSRVINIFMKKYSKITIEVIHSNGINLFKEK